MKRIFTFFFIFVNLTCYSQKDTLLRYSEITTVDSVLKPELFNRAKQWIAEVFKDSKNVIQIEDKENGQFLLKSNVKTFFTDKNFTGSHNFYGRLHFTMNILIKDGKFKAELYDLIFYSDDSQFALDGNLTSSRNFPGSTWAAVGQKRMNAMWAILKNNSDVECRSILLDFKESMAKKINTDF